MGIVYVIVGGLVLAGLLYVAYHKWFKADVAKVDTFINNIGGKL